MPFSPHPQTPKQKKKGHTNQPVTSQLLQCGDGSGLQNELIHTHQGHGVTTRHILGREIRHKTPVVGSETEKKKTKFPTAYREKKGIPEIWRHPTWQVQKFFMFCLWPFLVMNQSQFQQIQSWNIQQQQKKELLNLLGGTTHHQHGALDVLHVQVLLASWDWSRNTTQEVNQCSVGDWGLPFKETLA